MDPRGFPTTLPEFQRVFPTDAACASYLEKLRWADGFACASCGVIGEPFRFAARPHVLRCRSCRADTSLRAETVMQSTHGEAQAFYNSCVSAYALGGEAAIRAIAQGLVPK